MNEVLKRQDYIDSMSSSINKLIKHSNKSIFESYLKLSKLILKKHFLYITSIFNGFILFWIIDEILNQSQFESENIGITKAWNFSESQAERMIYL